MTSPAAPAGPRRALAWACGALVVAAGAFCLARAIGAPGDSAYGKWDLEILERWGRTGVLAPLAELPDHLLKPGYILYLRSILGSRAPFPIGRILIVNALLIVGAMTAVTLALWKARRFSAALLAAAFFLLYSPLRDCADDVVSEVPAAAGLLACLALTLIAVEEREGFVPFAGVCAAVLTLVRPNVGEVAVAIGALAVGATPRGLRKMAILVACFVAATALFTAVGRWKDVPLSPLSVEASTPLLWGAADYYWKPDAGPWPTGATAAEKGRAERRSAGRLWEEKLRRRNFDDRRALLWKAGHAVLSSEQLPARKPAGASMVWDKVLRRWWWLAALALLSASAAATTGRGPWRFVPALMAAAIVVQGIVFGADPRFALPLIPAWWIALLLAWPEVRLLPRAVAAALITPGLFLALLAAAPDAASSDYSVVRGPAPLSFAIPARAFPKAGERATLHARFLELSQKFDRGLSIAAEGREIARYEPEPARPYPSSVRALIAGDLLETGRRVGLTIEIRPLGDSGWNFFYFPLVPPPWSEPATIGGAEAIESGYGGTNRGGIPYWIHEGADPEGRP